MIVFRVDPLWTLAPAANAVYREAFLRADDHLAHYGILNSAQRLSHFLGQVLHETRALQRLEESLNYSATRLMAVWPARFPSLELAERYAMNPQRLATYVYGGRMGNRMPSDGFRFRGRGLVQLTGRANYVEMGILTGLDLVAEPDLVLRPEHAVQIAAAFWQSHGCNEAADTDDVRRVTTRLNGGTVGLVDRIAWLQQVRRVYGGPASRDA